MRPDPETFNTLALAGASGADEGILTDWLAASLWANVRAASFDEVMEAVRSLGGDAIARAAAGAFAGGRFGKDGLPSAATNRIPARERVAEMAQRYAQSDLT